MKKNFTRIYMLAALTLSLGACEKTLDPKIDNTYGDETTWTLPDKAQGVLMNAYANVPTQFNSYEGTQFLDVATDNAVTNAFGSAMYRLGAGGLSVTNNPVGTWGTAYNQFRNIHLFLENGLTDKIRYNLDPTNNFAVDKSIKNRLKGEAYFLRAWWGFKLLQQYGGKTSDGKALGYPIVTKTLTDAEAQNVNITRNTYEECVTRILADCDTALKYLPRIYTGGDLVTGIAGLGRADQQTSIALKSIVTVYAASPAYQPDNIVRINGMGQFTVVDATKYRAKWDTAAKYTQAAVNLLGSTLTPLVVTAPGVTPIVNHFNSNNTPVEFIWRRFANNRQLEDQNYPPYNYGNGLTNPSQNLVNAFPARNGYPITDPRARTGATPYDPANPYANRDPRLDLNVYYNNRVLPFDATSPTPDRVLETFTGGRDSRTVLANATRTGYYLRKWMSVQDRMLDPANPLNDIHYHVMIRKTEIILNMAEASNEAYGPTGVAPVSGARSAVALIKDIRRAAGITEATGNAYVDEVAAKGKDEFRKLIQNERRLELAFENHRYFDMRRWVLPLNEPIRGVEITRTAPTQFTYQEVEVEKRGFNDVKYYYLPLPYDELVKSPGIQNNLGW